VNKYTYSKKENCTKLVLTCEVSLKTLHEIFPEKELAIRKAG